MLRHLLIEVEQLDFIRCENLTHIYNQGMENEYKALDNVSLSIKEGEFVTILGTNGSGKSTLAKHFNALLQPASGKCFVGGRDTSNEKLLWDIRQQIGMVFQNPDNQIIAAIVEDDVAFGPENIGMKPSLIKEHVASALAAVDMEDYRSFAPHLLSGGQKQRIAIAGAIAMNPQCLVLDEPTAMLDPQGRLEVMSTVKQLNHDHSITIINITHFMDEAALADRVIVMDKGKVVKEGTPREIFSDAISMKRMGLDVPVVAEVAFRLKDRGENIPDGIMTTEELVNALCQ